MCLSFNFNFYYKTSLMATRWLICIKYKNKYYVWYNHWDSYLSGLGKELIKELHEMIINNQLTSYWINLIENLKYDTDIIVNAEGSIQSALKNGVYDMDNLSYKQEYIYIIDVDEKIFTVTSSRENLTYSFDQIENNLQSILNYIDFGNLK